MEDKKKIIVGAALLGASGLAYLLTRKQPTPPPPPQTYTCPYCDETFSTYGELLAHIQAVHPEEPPVEVGYITGHIANKITGAKVVNATIYVDSALDCHSNAEGLYVTRFVGYGAHTLLVQADNYQEEEFQVTVDSQTKTLNLQLSPIPVTPPGEDWLEDMSVDKIVLTPATVYPGQEVEIQIRTKYCPGPLHFDITGSVHIDGVTLTETFRLDNYNPWYYFHYTPQSPGTYTISSGGSSTTLTVLKEEVATYYSPFGGVKWPLVTDIVFPDVEPFTIETQGYYDVPLIEYPWVFAGGNLKLSDILSHVIPGYWGSPYYLDWITEPSWTCFAISPPFDGILSSHLANAQPAATDMSGCPMDKYGIRVSWLPVIYPAYSYPIILAMITDKQGCGDCWNSKEALAQMIGRTHPNTASPYYPTNPPREMATPAYTVCGFCNGTGMITVSEYGEQRGCPFCLGIAYGADPWYRGKLWTFDIYKGIKDWIYPPFVYRDPRVEWQSRYHTHYSTYCPYCRTPFTTGDLGEVVWHEVEKIAWARQFLEHIESSHPTHPLTEPAF